MSGTLKIRDDTTWMPAGWIFDAVLRSIGKELEREDVTLAERLRNAQTDRYGYDDLHTLDSEKFRILQRSAEQAYMLAREQGPQANSVHNS